jgi:drug/metabolite transporter (DMT)-like permease
VVQVLWKSAALSLEPDLSLGQTLLAILHRPVFLAVGVLMACQLGNWLKVLAHADLSYAQPITSLSYVTVCLGSTLILGEHIDPMQMLGIGCILAGVWLVSRTAATSPSDESRP